jgi:FkbM family methyltransferase
MELAGLVKRLVLSSRAGRALRQRYWNLREAGPRPARRALARVARYDQETREVLARVLQPDSTSIDVGAHEGVFLREMIRLAPNGTHHAFEPLPEFAQRLRLRFGSTRVHIHELALSDAEGVTTFTHVTSNPAYSGLRARTYPRPDETISALRVIQARLDDLLAPEQPVHLIKVDVEGAELQVLRGAKRTLTRWRPVVVFEFGLGAADHYGTTPDDVWKLLVADCGLRISTMARWLRGRWPISRRAFARRFRSGRDFYFIASGDAGPLDDHPRRPSTL